MYDRMFQVDDVDGTRWDTALTLLRDGTPVVVQDIALQPEKDAFQVSVVSRWVSPNEHAAMSEIQRARSLLDHLLGTDPRFAEVVDDRPLQIELVDDYGMGATTICFLDESGTLRWTPNQ